MPPPFPLPKNPLSTCSSSPLSYTSPLRPSLLSSTQQLQGCHPPQPLNHGQGAGQQIRHATFIPRPHRPYTFNQLVTLSDGSTYTQRTTSPAPTYVSSKDVRNSPLWNPTSKRLLNVEQDEAGKLRRFREKFGRGFDAYRESQEEEDAVWGAMRAKQSAIAPAKAPAISPGLGEGEGGARDGAETQGEKGVVMPAVPAPPVPQQQQQQPKNKEVPVQDVGEGLIGEENLIDLISGFKRDLESSALAATRERRRERQTARQMARKSRGPKGGKK